MTEALKGKVRFYLVDCQTLPGKIIDILLILLNIITCMAYALETYGLSPAWDHRLLYLEITTVSIFAVEYLLRLWVADNRLRHIFTPYALIDLVSILPVFSSVLDLRFLRVARVFRIFRFMRFLQDEKFFFGRIGPMHLRVMRLCFTALAIIFLASSAIYEAEKNINQDFSTLGDAIYFTVVTITTVGFGDMVPVTAMGRAFTTIMILAGAILIPYHIGQIARQFFLESKHRETICPGCSLTFHNGDAHFCRRCGEALPDDGEEIKV